MLILLREHQNRKELLNNHGQEDADAPNDGLMSRQTRSCMEMVCDGYKHNKIKTDNLPGGRTHKTGENDAKAPAVVKLQPLVRLPSLGIPRVQTGRPGV